MSRVKMVKGVLTEESPKEKFNLYWFVECLEEAIEKDDFARVKAIVKNGRKQLGTEPLVQITSANGRVLSIYP